MNGIVKIQLTQFAMIYLLLLVVLAIMKICRINQTKQLVLASLRMTLQLTLAGYLLTYVFAHPHPLFTVAYVLCMTGFSIFRVLRPNRTLNRTFKWIISGSIAFCGLSIIAFFICVVVGESIFNPQYVIPISGMIMGNTMTGVSLGVKTFRESLNGQQPRIEALQNIGARPQAILLPFVKQALETALLPTMNSMLGMGIVSLPGMMTGQILSGTAPTTSILYQIAIMVAICTVVCTACFGSLFFGYRTLWNKRDQIITTI